MCFIDSETQFQFSFRSPFKNKHIYGFYIQQDPISKFIPVYIEKRDNFLVYYWVRMAGNRDQDPFKYQISELVHIHGLAVLAWT